MKKKNNNIKLTNLAIQQIQKLIKKKKNKQLKLRVFIKGGGCNGFQYKFHLDKEINNDDIIIKKCNIFIIIDIISIQYLNGSTIDFLENLEGSKFIIYNPKAKNTCSCGSSFNI